MKKLMAMLVLLLPLYGIWGALKEGSIGIELIAPMEKSLYHEELASVVVALTSPDVTKIIISAEANQSSEMIRQKGRDTYCKSIRLIPGENTITVMAMGKEGAMGKLSTVIYHDIVTDKAYKYPPEMYTTMNFHLPANEKVCVPCHKMEVNELPGIAFNNPSDSNCFTCHQKLTTRGKGHAPAINWLCTSCHKTAQMIGDEGNKSVGTPKFRLPPLVGDECLSCHKKEREQWAEKNYHHLPFDANQCVRCHNPHSSEHQFHLKAKAWDICTSCHIDKRDGNHFINTFGSKNHPTRGKPDPSRPGKELECISCHNPHASDTRSLIEGKSPMSICAKCHKK